MLLFAVVAVFAVAIVAVAAADDDDAGLCRRQGLREGTAEIGEQAVRRLQQCYYPTTQQTSSTGSCRLPPFPSQLV